MPAAQLQDALCEPEHAALVDLREPSDRECLVVIDRVVDALREGVGFARVIGTEVRRAPHDYLRLARSTVSFPPTVPT